MSINVNADLNIDTQTSGWILLRIERSREKPALTTGNSQAKQRVFPSFEYAQHISFAERFPRLTFFVIACGLLAAALITEIDCLQGSGYFWH